MKLRPPVSNVAIVVLAIVVQIASIAPACAQETTAASLLQQPAQPPTSPAPPPATPTATAGSTGTQGAGAGAGESEGTRRSFWPAGIGVGVTVGSQLAVDRDLPDDLGVGVLLRIVRRRRGFIPALSFGSRGSVTVDAQGADGVTVRTARVRPLMGGVGWIRPLAPRLSLQTEGLLGYSFNGLGDSNADAPRLGMPGAVSRVEDSFAWEVSSRVWYDLHPKVGLMAGIGYFHTRPELVLANGSRQSWNADRVTLEVGIAYTVFQRKKPAPAPSSSPAPPPPPAAAPGR